MAKRNDLTEGDLLGAMIRFSVSYLISCFLQTFYGMADLFITGQFNGAASITAVSVGSQVMHMLTVVIVGLAVGATVSISHAVGAKDERGTAKYIGNTVIVFAAVAAVLTAVLLILTGGIVSLLAVPKEAVREAKAYLTICFAGIPFITAYNIVSGIFRGTGDSKRPMIFVFIAGVINVGLDYLLIGPMKMGAAGAAYATVISQAVSVVLAVLSLRKKGIGTAAVGAASGSAVGDTAPASAAAAGGTAPASRPSLREAYAFDRSAARRILAIGFPIAVQEGVIQISFLIITAIANSRGVDVAAAVGIVEKIISFLFLVNSAMLSTVSTVAGQNAGAGNHGRGRKALRYGITICAAFGTAVFLLCQFISPQILSLFTKNEPEVVRLGAQYLRTYSLDCVFAGIHFCFSGYFSAYEKSVYSFLHNVISVVTVRVPGAYLASVYFPATLYPMGIAAPLGSLLSAVICIFLYGSLRRKEGL